MAGWKYAKHTLFPDSNMIVRGNGAEAERWDTKSKRWISDDRFLDVYFGFADNFKFIPESEAIGIIKGATR